MTVAEIKQRIIEGVDDDSIDPDVAMGWIIDADDRIQTWKPISDRDQSFDFWDYLTAEYGFETEAGVNAYTLPDDFRSFIDLYIGDDEQPYILVNLKSRNKYKDHVCWIIGNTLYIKATPESSGLAAALLYTKFTEAFTSDTDEPEIERPYHQAYVYFGKARYYNQVGDTELERENMNDFERIMMNKKRDQEIARMKTNTNSVQVPRHFMV